jgi:4-hydroxybenzoate polyprenyltransferase
MTESRESSSPSASDIVIDSWILRLSPAPLRPYLKLARLDRPIGTWLLLFPCWWSLSLGMAVVAGFQAGAWPPWDLVALFAVGALVMRGAGCTFNDIVDRDIDARVARTATRPIPSGQVGVKQAVIFLGLQLLVGLGVLLQFNRFTIWLGAASLLLVFTYPFMKRITYWPQAWLGLTFNWGALMGWSAVVYSLDWPPLLLYLGGIAWTLGYDTIYAHQDLEDDALVGVKSTALKFGARTKIWLVGFYGTAVVFMVAAGHWIELGWPYWIGMALVAAQFAWQIEDVKLDDPGDCLAKFKSNRMVGWIVLIAIAAGAIWG